MLSLRDDAKHGIDRSDPERGDLCDRRAERKFSRFMRDEHERRLAFFCVFLLHHLLDGDILPSEDRRDLGEYARLVVDGEAQIICALEVGDELDVFRPFPPSRCS